MTSLAARYNMKIRQFDVTTAYLNGELEEEVFMETPKNLPLILERIVDDEQDSFVGIKAKDMLSEIQKGDKVCKLRKSLYGLKQAGRSWYKRLNKVLKECGTTPTNSDPCLYRIGSGENLTMIAVYVDDILIASRHEKEITKVGQKLSSHFEVKSLGEVNYCLGVEFTQGNGNIAMHQRGYVKDLLSRFGMTDSKPVATPIDASLKLERNESGSEEDSKLPYRELVGALTYLATTTRPDISFAASHLGQFNNCFSVQHWKAAKRVLRYLKGDVRPRSDLQKQLRTTTRFRRCRLGKQPRR